MSLFDDLLTKVQPSSMASNSSGSYGSTGQQDPIAKTNGPITISASTPIATNQEVHMTPIVPTVITVPEEPPVIAITEAPMIGISPIQPEVPVANISPIEEEKPMQNTSPLFEMTESPIQNQDDLMPTNNTTSFIEDNYTENTISDEVILSDDLITSSPLFDMSNDSVPSNDSIIPADTFSEVESPKELPIIEASAYRTSNSDASFRNTKEYLKHAFEEVEVLIATIDQENENKIKERESYRAQKEHFAELELQAE